tara:strand:+ start:10546 stop:11556 length:1011 start_codon:yes stop_codon:yes gene_type:complete
MFKRTKNLINNIRIAVDFISHDRRQRHEHELQAEIKYCTKQQIEKRNSLLKSITLDASTMFDELIDQKAKERALAKDELDKFDLMISLFVRNYKEELNVLHNEKDALLEEKNELYKKTNELKGQISYAFEKKDEAYRELNQAKNGIDSWHAKSKRTTWLLGNSARKLPRHSLFGQSHGDLDSYKNERDSAYNDVIKAKSEIGSLKEKQRRYFSSINQMKESVGNIFNKINEVKNDRSKMYELKNAGHTKRNLQIERDKIFNNFGMILSELNKFNLRKNEYIEFERGKRGLNDLEMEIKELEEGKAEFLKSFDDSENEISRIRQHRDEWLQKHNADQ